MVLGKYSNLRVILVAILTSTFSVMILTSTPTVTRQFSSPTSVPSTHLRSIFSIISSHFERHFFSSSPPSSPLSLRKEESFKTKCAFPLVYHKPPKTASSFIQSVITEWTEETGRGNYICAQRPAESNILLHECVSSSGDACGVLNCHIFLDSHARALLTERLPNHRLLTSTRYPPHRIVSFFLHLNNYRASNLQNETGNVMNELRQYLSEYNPWKLYNYHTGEARSGACPLTQGEKVTIFSMAARYHIVIDANLRHVSNAILKQQSLFTLPHVEGERNKDRGAYKLSLPGDIQNTIQHVSCVERVLHRSLQLRMASLYETATGTPCVFQDGSTCIEHLEKEALQSNWISQ